MNRSGAAKPDAPSGFPPTRPDDAGLAGTRLSDRAGMVSRAERAGRARERSPSEPRRGERGKRGAPASSLIGHSATWALLQRLLERERLPAAVLLAGPPGVGKRTMASRLARELLSVSTDAELAAHPDVLRLSPLEDAAMRGRLVSLLHQVSERPVRAEVRLILLEHVDQLSAAAAALLLKAIEDAPAYAKFFLTATVLDRVAPTVRSRALVRTLTPLPEDTLTRELHTRGFSAVEELARLSGGRPGLALRLAADPDLLRRYRAWGAAMTHLRASDMDLRLGDDAEMAKEFFAFLESTLRRGTPSATLVRRVREAEAMLRQHVPPHFVVEYVVRDAP
ncbi:MAG: hypothetical protein G01um101438_39 [Parcubacteria group bacterium Gr01-1014_38]|nr:MAG: hypothetical protein G01um101438_39 [Parcubacteria group bacterium Gr01-1014_38]